MKTNPKNNTPAPLPADNGGEGTPPSLIDHLLDRNPKRKNGAGGSYRLRLLLVDKLNMVGRKLRLGLRTGRLTEARQRAWVAISALRNAGVHIGNIVVDACGRRVDLNSIEPPCREAFGEPLPSRRARRDVRSTRPRANDSGYIQDEFRF